MKNIINTLPTNLLCFSHLRWDFVYQRPQHLLSRFAAYFKVYFLEEPLFEDCSEASLSFSPREGNIFVGVPHLPHGLSEQEVTSTVGSLLNQFLQDKDLEDFAFWYYSPMAMSFSEKHTPKVTIYDCMDELSAFKNAPKALKDMEKKLMKYADVVFTGGHSLYEAKKNQHANIYPFPSSIEKEHFAKARKAKAEPQDQAGIKGPKLGFYGVIDERFDIELIRGIADARPDWQIMLIGPVVKIDPATLPKNANIHYLGQKTYKELPAYLSGWDVALIPFALNESTRFISPTKTPEYLAAGIPVVSTPIKDVVNPYGTKNLVHIGVTAQEFVLAIDQELAVADRKQWLKKVDTFLALNSWDMTHQQMQKHILNVARSKNNISVAS
ncbi:glycosyltransferase family 1 protein [Mucilaginibacter sp. PAMB04274]|uniref:glycosyltransferase family 1 protein n=1 Tax=Mucilaginibacter sp. PAMB04274 TaxID=3138568 RepID=UPI0031F70E05